MGGALVQADLSLRLCLSQKLQSTVSSVAVSTGARGMTSASISKCNQQVHHAIAISMYSNSIAIVVALLETSREAMQSVMKSSQSGFIMTGGVAKKQHMYY